MGSAESRGTVHISNSFFHLVQTSQNDQIINKIRADKKLLTVKMNRRGDTVTHFACAQNNIGLVKSLRGLRADFTIRNNIGETPFDLTFDQQILTIFKKTVKTYAQDKQTENQIQNKKTQIKVLRKQIDIQSQQKISNALLDDNKKQDERLIIILKQKDMIQVENTGKPNYKPLICVCHYGLIS